MRRGTVAALTLMSFTITAHAQPSTLTLACKGTVTDGACEQTPISMGLIINFTARTVKGFNSPDFMDYPVKITAANDVTVTFAGTGELAGSQSSTRGSMD